MEKKKKKILIKIAKHVKKKKNLQNDFFLLYTNSFEGTLFLAYQMKQIFHRWNPLEWTLRVRCTNTQFKHTPGSRDSRPFSSAYKYFSVTQFQKQKQQKN